MGIVVVAFVCGLLFALGLAIGGMLDPAKVLAFLDVTGDWDPSLAFVMGAAVLVYTVAFRLLLRYREPWSLPRLQLPSRGDIDAPLLVGAMLFGAGWGLVGLCPGPALVGLASTRPSTIVFVVMMLLGMALHDAASRLVGRGR